MAERTIKRRGGGKKKTLLSTNIVTYRLDCGPEEAEELRKSFITAFPNLETYLNQVEESVKATLKAHDLPTTWPEILPYTKNWNLPVYASYAADILYSIHEVREFIKIGDAHGAAYEAIRLGGYISCNNAESAADGRESGRTSNARDAKTEKTKARRERMEAIAKELFNWKPGENLTPSQRRKVNETLLMESDLKDRPTSAVLSADALIIGFRKKKPA